MDAPTEKQITGRVFSSKGIEKFYSISPLRGLKNQTAFLKVTSDEVNRAAVKASAALLKVITRETPDANPLKILCLVNGEKSDRLII